MRHTIKICGQDWHISAIPFLCSTDCVTLRIEGPRGRLIERQVRARELERLAVSFLVGRRLVAPAIADQAEVRA